MAEPPLEGGVKVTVAWASPAVADTPVGAPGGAIALSLSITTPWLATVAVYPVASVPRPECAHKSRPVNGPVCPNILHVAEMDCDADDRLNSNTDHAPLANCRA